MSTTQIDQTKRPPEWAPTPPTGPCPYWCRLPADHGWDGWNARAGRWSRGHQGPYFGRISVGGVETQGKAGISLDSDATGTGDLFDLTPAQWREFAADAIRAAEWLEEHA